MSVQTFVEKHKVLTPVLFWGAWLLLILGLMVWRDNEPNLDVLEYQDEIYQETYPQYPWTQ